LCWDFIKFTAIRSWIFIFKPIAIRNEAFYYFDPLHWSCKRVYYYFYLFVLTLYTIRVKECFPEDMYYSYKSLKYINDSIYLIRNKKIEKLKKNMNYWSAVSRFDTKLESDCYFKITLKIDLKLEKLWKFTERCTIARSRCSKNFN
jgi:hypothetical protein